MDIISPDVLWIDGSCYRINCANSLIETDDYNYDDDISEEDPEENDDLVYTTCSNGRVKASLHVPQFFYGFIIGSKGATIKQIKNDTRTEIKLPPRGMSGDIIITGPSTKNIATAVRRIKMIIMANRQKQRPNYFLSIPMTDESIAAGVKSFKDSILSEAVLPIGVDESIFIRSEKLHLTVLVMFLADKEEIETAVKLLKEAKDTVIDPLTIKNNCIDVSLHGVSYMNDDPSAVRVLYADVKETDSEKSGQLQNLLEKLNDFFYKSGFIVGAQTNVKIHVTLMNVRKRLPPVEKKFSKPFDATKILKKYETHVFGQQKITNVLLSQMGVEDSDNYYPTIAEVSL